MQACAREETCYSRNLLGPALLGQAQSLGAQKGCDIESAFQELRHLEEETYFEKYAST